MACSNNWVALPTSTIDCLAQCRAPTLSQTSTAEEGLGLIYFCRIRKACDPWNIPQPLSTCSGEVLLLPLQWSRELIDFFESILYKQGKGYLGLQRYLWRRGTTFCFVLIIAINLNWDQSYIYSLQSLP